MQVFLIGGNQQQGYRFPVSGDDDLAFLHAGVDAGREILRGLQQRNSSHGLYSSPANVIRLRIFTPMARISTIPSSWFTG